MFKFVKMLILFKPSLKRHKVANWHILVKGKYVISTDKEWNITQLISISSFMLMC